ncbi:MAG: hypothetical protein ACK5XN_04690, partial [Bacteroidota bacterium]
MYKNFFNAMKSPTSQSKTVSTKAPAPVKTPAPVQQQPNTQVKSPVVNTRPQTNVNILPKSTS